MSKILPEPPIPQCFERLIASLLSMLERYNVIRDLLSLTNGPYLGYMRGTHFHCSTCKYTWSLVTDTTKRSIHLVLISATHFLCYTFLNSAPNSPASFPRTSQSYNCNNSCYLMVSCRRTIRGRSCAVAIAGCVYTEPSGLSSNVLLLYSLPLLLLLQGDVTATHLKS